MNKNSLIIVVLLSFITGCSDDYGTNKSLVTSIERLNSPDSSYSLYRYNVESSMAFGSGTVRLTILKSKNSLDYNTSDFFTVDGYGPVVFGWQKPNTINLAVLTSGAKTSKEPYKHETKRWKDFIFEIDYYNMYSTFRSPFTFESYCVNGDTITFLKGSESKSFVKGKAEISYDGSMFEIREIKTKVDIKGKEVGKGKVIVSSSSWEMTPTKKFDFSSFVSSGVLIKKKLL